jgi:hypothetical protein
MFGRERLAVNKRAQWKFEIEGFNFKWLDDVKLIMKVSKI